MGDMIGAGLPDELKQRLDLAVERIVELAQPRLVILFGSYAEGRGREDSDLDILVVADTDKPYQLGAEIRRQVRPILRPCPFDVLVYSVGGWDEKRRIRGFVARDADQKGLRLYEAALEAVA
jgi:uncharacterized protein